MMYSFYLLLCLFLIASSNAQKSGSSGPLVFGYVEPRNWGDYQSIANFDGNRLTHVIYAFAYPSSSGNVTLYKTEDGPAREADAISTPMKNDAPAGQCPCSGACLKGHFHQLIYLKRKFPHLKTILSIGGWTFSCEFSSIFADPTKTTLFIQSSTELMLKYGFDGIDIDWEFPGKAQPGCPTSNNDWSNAVKVTSQIKAHWKSKIQQYNEYILTVCLPATNDPQYQESLKDDILTRIAPNVDYLLVMAYEYQWGSKYASHGAPLNYTGTETTRGQLAVAPAMAAFSKFIPKSKLVLGIPAYAMGLNIQPQSDTSTCLGASTLNLPAPASSSALPTINYLELQKLISQKSFSSPNLDSKSVAAWSCNKTAFYSFDTPATLKSKMDFVINEKLAGAMIWDLSTDYATNNPLSLLAGLTQKYSPDTSKRRRFICIPRNDFCNVACGKNQNPFEQVDSNTPPIDYKYDTDFNGSNDSNSQSSLTSKGRNTFNPFVESPFLLGSTTSLYSEQFRIILVTFICIMFSANLML